uniref:Uncharacterized protein n=1 Tax=Picea sitchensis TaxID=3332 RepID=A9NLT3_PICSI|nr:unknown [Picea sitchensis]
MTLLFRPGSSRKQNRGLMKEREKLVASDMHWQKKKKNWAE